MKKWVKHLFLFTVVMMLSVNIAYASGGDEVTIILNGEAIEFQNAKPFIDADGVVHAPIGEIIEAEGATYSTKKQIQTFLGEPIGFQNTTTIHTDRNDYRFCITNNGGSEMIFVENKTSLRIEMDSRPSLIEDTIYMPLQYLAMVFGMHMGWDSENDTVYLVDTGIERGDMEYVNAAGFTFTIDPENSDFYVVTDYEAENHEKYDLQIYFAISSRNTEDYQYFKRTFPEIVEGKLDPENISFIYEFIDKNLDIKNSNSNSVIAFAEVYGTTFTQEYFYSNTLGKYLSIRINRFGMINIHVFKTGYRPVSE